MPLPALISNRYRLILLLIVILVVVLTVWSVGRISRPAPSGPSASPPAGEVPLSEVPGAFFDPTAATRKRTLSGHIRPLYNLSLYPEAFYQLQSEAGEVLAVLMAKDDLLELPSAYAGLVEVVGELRKTYPDGTILLQVSAVSFK